MLQRLDRERPGTSKREDYQVQLSDVCRQRLLGYADSFAELARSFEREEEPVWTDPPAEGAREQLLYRHRLWEGKQVLGEHMREMAGLMGRLARVEFRILPVDEKKKKRIHRLLGEEEIRVGDICSIPDENGHRRLALTLQTPKKGGIPAGDVANLLTCLLGRQVWLSATSPYMIAKERKLFFFVEEPTYVVLGGFSRAVKEGEAVSGDNYSFLELEQGRMTMLLSDGTGSGEQASADSERVLDLMEKMLEAGYSAENAARTVNALWYAGFEDCSHPTLDLCDLDLYEGSGMLCKVGGVSSFLKRGGLVERYGAQNLPLGIFQSPAFCREQIRFQDGDYLIMMTDGVWDAFGESAVESAIGQMDEISPGEMAERLMRLALVAGEGRIADDMTILVAGIRENRRQG